MKRLLLALLAAVWAASACTAQVSDGTYQFTSGTPLGKVIPIKDRKPAATFTGDLIDGGTIGSRDLRGEVTLLNFWATWCPPCRIESPQLDIVYRRMRDKGVAFIGVDTKDAKSNARAFVQDFNISYPIVYDEQGEIAVRLGNLPARGMPFSVLLDKSGKVAAVYLGQLTAKDIAGPLKSLLAEQLR